MIGKLLYFHSDAQNFMYFVFVLDEFEMALFQSEKLARKRKAEFKHYKRIMGDPELNAS